MKTLVAYVPGRNNYHFDFLPRFKGEAVNFIEQNQADRIANINLYSEKLTFAREHGCNNLSIVGYGEPLLNRPYIEMIDTLNRRLSSPFNWIELKTNGSQLAAEDTDAFEFLQNSGIKTIVLYLSAFDDFKHHQMMTGGNTSAANAKFDIKLLCEQIKAHGFNLRLEVFLTKWLEYMTLDDIIKHTHELQADQITLRKLVLTDDHDTNDWIKSNGCQPETVLRIQEALSEETQIGITTTNYPIYGIKNISFVLNDGRHLQENLENMYLLPNVRLYRKSDNLGSLIF